MNHDLKIRYDADIGVHRIYNKFRYQPGTPIAFKYPRRNARFNYFNGTLNQFFKFCDQKRGPR